MLIKLLRRAANLKSFAEASRLLVPLGAVIHNSFIVLKIFEHYLF